MAWSALLMSWPSVEMLGRQLMHAASMMHDLDATLPHVSGPACFT